MSNELSSELKRQLFSQEADDPFLTLVTLTHTTFTARLVNNTKDIVSNGFTFSAFPMRIRLPVDDGESARDFTLEFDNVSLELIQNLRSVTTPIGVKLELILASMPNTVQLSYEDLQIRSVGYDAKKISAKVVLDNFLAVAMTSEKYNPSNFPGLFG
jgi:hypothetical protein